jgi:uncharacterized protein (DUF1499 family)
MGTASSTPGIAVLGTCLAVLCCAAVVFSGLGTRWGLWEWSTGLAILKWSTMAALAVAAICIIALALSVRAGAGAVLSALGIVISLVAAAPTLGAVWTVKHVPLINDITTDVENPPQFVAILPLRKDAPTPAQYPGKDVATQQLRGYPDIKPVESALPPAAAFDKALDAARRMGWHIVDFSSGEGRIEATDSTLWFGFTDDIVIRVTPSGAGSRIDMRSVSRVGKSDVGINAKRIRAFFKTMRGE